MDASSRLTKHYFDRVASSDQKVGSYELLAKIGEGGMGVVHLADGPQGRRVAVKLLRPHVVGDDQGRARMAREVTSLRRVRSPRVAEVYDADPWGDTPYVVTRYVPGPSLHDHVDRHGPIRGDNLVTLARGLAEALVAVHAADVLHRDVKPSNVLIEGRNPVLIDFGLAQLADDSRLTQTGWMLGTPGYLAPEILYGDDPTQKADVHSWAATVVYAATGRGPYGRGPAVAVMDRVRRGEHDLSGVPDSLYWMISRALEPDPRDRPSSSQLVDWMSGTVVPAAPRPPSVQPADRAKPAQPDRSPDPGAPTDLSWPAPARRANRLAATLFWVGMTGIVVAGAVTAPAITAIGVFLAAWILRTVTVRGDMLAGWRRQRGVRRNDSLVANACVPWFGVLALPGAIANAGLAIIDGAIVVVIATLTTDLGSLAFVLAPAGLIAALFVWWGPFSRDVRIGARSVTGTLLRPGAATVTVLLLVGATAIGLIGVHQVSGAVYAPLPHPPWEQPLRDLVP